jgi:adenine-specific DNA-methyltransferase
LSGEGDVASYEGRLELTWTNKARRLLAHDDGSYEWVDPADYRVAEVRLLDDLATVGEVGPNRAADNLLVRGDALNALRSLAHLPEFAEQYLGKVKLAYLDPPFNTQQSFLHYDDNLEHSVWLTMMRDRLIQIRDLLAPDGSIWVHLDDDEQHRLRLLMDEVFGSGSYVGTVVWRSSDNSNNDAKQFSSDHNYIHVYGRSEGWVSKRLHPRADQTSHFANPDNDPKGPWFDGNPVNSPNPRPNLRYVVVSPTGFEIAPPSNGWRWSKTTLERKIQEGEIRFTADGKGMRRRTYLQDHRGLPASSLWVDLEETGHNRQAKSELKRLFPGVPTAELFETPKPERLLRKLLMVATEADDIVLDPFLGSGTTAAVAHKMGRRWIGIERESETIGTYATPRLTKVVRGQDPGGVTEMTGWQGGGGFRVLAVAPSMFEVDGGLVFLANLMTKSRLAEATAAQLGFAYGEDPPFAGRKGRTRLAVVDGVVNQDVVRILVPALGEGERIVICGTAIDPDARPLLQELRPGSSLRKIPAALLAEYRTGRQLNLDLLSPSAPSGSDGDDRSQPEPAEVGSTSG